MPKANDKTEMLRQNLVDAKCSKQMTAECMRLAQKGLYAQMLRELKSQRNGLLDEIHQSEYALRCLDYLMFQVEHNSIQEE